MTVPKLGSRTIIKNPLPRPLVDIRGLTVVTETTLDALMIKGMAADVGQGVVVTIMENSGPLMPLSGRWDDTADHYLQVTVPPLNMEGLLDVESLTNVSFPALRGVVSQNIFQPIATSLQRLKDHFTKRLVPIVDASREMNPVALEMVVAGGTIALAAASVASGMIFIPVASVSDSGPSAKEVLAKSEQGPKGKISKRPSLFSGEAIKGFFSGPLGPPNITWAFLRYWEAQSLVRGGRIDDAINSYDSAIAAFKRAKAYGYVGQTAAIKGFAVLGVDMGKEDPGDAPGTRAAKEAFRAFKTAVDAYAKVGNDEYALICMEMMARVSRGVTTRASIMSQLWDLPIHDGAGVPDADLNVLAKKLGGWWLSDKAVGKTLELGVPLAIGELPHRLVQQGLTQILGREDLAEKIEIEPLRREITKEMEKDKSRPTIDRVRVIKWLSEHLRGLGGADNLRAELDKALAVIEAKIEDPAFRAGYVRKIGENRLVVTNAGIHEVLKTHYGLDKEMRGLPAREMPSGDGERQYSSTKILGQVLSITNEGGEIDRLTTKITKIIMTPEFPDRYFENGELTDAGLNEAIRIVTGGKVIVEETIDEADFEAGKGVTEVTSDDVLRIKVRAPMRAIRALLDGREAKGIKYPRWGNYGDEMKGKILEKMGRQISQMEREGRQVVVPVAGVGVEVNLPMLRMVIERVQQQIRIEKILTENYPDLKKDAVDHFERVVDGVIGILNRRSYTSQLDEDGVLREDLVIAAYSELLGGEARESESTADTEPDLIDFSEEGEGPTEEVHISKITD